MKKLGMCVMTLVTYRQRGFAVKHYPFERTFLLCSFLLRHIQAEGIFHYEALTLSERKHEFRVFHFFYLETIAVIKNINEDYPQKYYENNEGSYRNTIILEEVSDI